MKKVRDTDARSLSHNELTQLRVRAVKAIQAGQSPADVAAAFGVNRTTVYDWLALYRGGGWGALDAHKRGGRPSKLNGRDLRWLYNTLTMKNPLQMKFEFALWTVPMIIVLIKDRFGVKLSYSSVTRLLAQLGLTPQRPLWRAYQQNPEAVEHWIHTEFPKIKRLAKRRGVEIFFGDEAGVRSDHHSGTTWAPKGKTPVVSSTGARFGFNMISAVSSQGSLRFMVVEGKVGAAKFIEFLKRLTHGSSHPVFLVVDGHPSHKAKMVKQYVASLDGQLELFILPGYSPELNPDEYVWNNLKNALGRVRHETKDKMKQMAVNHLRKLQKLPDLIMSFFSAPSTAYAA